MTNFLNKIIGVLSDYQKIAVKSLIERKTKSQGIKSLRVKSEESQKIYSEIKSYLGGPLTTPIYAVEGEKISSENHNSNMEKIYIDLNTLYMSIANLSSVGQSNTVALDSEYVKSRAAIEKLLNDARVFSLRKQYENFNDIKVIDFNFNRNNSSIKPAAVVDPDTRLLELPVLYTSKVQLPNRLSRFTTVYTKVYTTGIHGPVNSSLTTELMADQRPETFWGYYVIADAPVEQVYEKKSISSEGQVDAAGPVVEIYFSFSHSEKINTVRLLPFAEFPVTILDIAYSTTDNTDYFISFKNFTQESTLDWVEYNFDPVFAKTVRITISQINYRLNSYNIPKNLVIGTDIFQEIFNAKTSALSSQVIFDSDQYRDTLGTISSYDAAISSLESLVSDNDVNSISNTALDYLDNYRDLVEGILKQSAIPASTELISVSKYEYLLGIREVEITYEIYGPIGHFSSEKFKLSATPSEVAIEVDAEYPASNGIVKTSVEWELDIGQGRKIPIHPRNITGDYLTASAMEERLIVDNNTRLGYTRLGAYYGTPYYVRKDGEILDVQEYSFERITGSIPKIKINLTGDSFSKTSIYTVSYAVSPASQNIDILGNFKSKHVTSPEVFTGLGSDNNIVLSKYPFINYEVINGSAAFAISSGESKWVLTPPQENFASGQFLIYPTITDSAGNILQTGSITGYSISGLWGTHSGETKYNYGNILSASYFSQISGIDYGYYLQLMDSSDYVEISSFNTSITGLVLTQPYTVTLNQASVWASQATGLSFVGSLVDPVSGYLQVDYAIGVGVKTDDKVFVLSDKEYEPIQVKIGGKLAKNITNYETLIHPAFSISSSRDSNFEYIQAGNSIYFNQNTDAEISVEYDWIAEYLAVNSVLRCNKKVNPDLTPKIDEIRILINNMVI